ncbi:hypothetical protein BS78_08G123800 [Paspalum vaginatum]|nr:hypothetical protein BS78_08G123800 [Paspalum vaginatum]
MAAAMAPLKALIITALLLLLASTYTLAEAAPRSSSSSAAAVYRLELIHVDANGNFTKDELIHRAEHRSHARAAVTFTGGDDDGHTYLETASFDSAEYLLKLRIGKPERPFLAVADTGSDETWTKKRELCDPSGSSSSFSKCQDQHLCDFRRTYGSGKVTVQGIKADEVLTLSLCRYKLLGRWCVRTEKKQVSIPLGCAVSCSKGCDKVIPEGADGILGLDLSPRSFLSLLRKKEKITKLSYCLSSRLQPHLSSPLWFGGAELDLAAAVPPVPGVQSAPLVSIAAATGSPWSYKYYVELVGVSMNVGGGAHRVVELSGNVFNHRSNVGIKNGVMLVDSGCSFSKLETPAFNAIKNLLEEGLKTESFLPEDKDKRQWTCFHKPWTHGDHPDIVLTLHLGGGAKMPLPWSSYMMPMNIATKDGEPPKELSCLAIKDADENISILGNFQQQNIHMLYDLQPSKTKELLFAPVQDCSKREL